MSSGVVLFSMSVSKRAILRFFPKPVKNALALVERFEPSMTKTSFTGNPQRLPSDSISDFSSPSGMGVNLLKSGMI